MNLNLGETSAQFTALGAMAWTWASEFLPRFGTAIVVFVLGAMAASWIARAVRAALHRAPQVDQTIVPIVGTTVRYAILIVVVIAALGQIGVQTTSLLAVLGAAGLAIGLALQGTLSNIAAGIMLIYLRPFRAGDYIECDTFAGIVRTVGLFVTELDTFDGIYVFAPNSEIWNKTLKNNSRNPRRMMSIPIGVSYDADTADARKILLAIADADRRILKDPPPIVFVDKYGDNSVDLMFRAWAPNAIFWDVQRDTIEAAKHRLEAAGIEIPFPQRIVHVVGAGGRPAPLAANPGEESGAPKSAA